MDLSDVESKIRDSRSNLTVDDQFRNISIALSRVLRGPRTVALDRM